MRQRIYYADCNQPNSGVVLPSVCGNIERCRNDSTYLPFLLTVPHFLRMVCMGEVRPFCISTAKQIASLSALSLFPFLDLNWTSAVYG